MLSVSIYTLGCKLNQLESESLADAFRLAGCSLWEESPGGPFPDIIIINTCTVTSRADQKARRVIRKFLRDNPVSCVIVTGCYAALDKEKIMALEDKSAEQGRLFVTGNKAALLDLPACLEQALKNTDNTRRTGELIARCLTDPGAQKGNTGEGGFRFAPEKFSFHTRALLKIQDGCDNRCSYCRIRLARGPSRSVAREQALAELRLLEAAGYWEAVLTGVNVTQYREQADDAEGLAGLLRFLLEGTETIGLRLSSLDPVGITGELAGVLAHPRIRPHFHLSVQSGSESVLRKMGRTYSGLAVEKAAALLRSVKNNPFLACDIITGFPGEGEMEFEQTLSLCRAVNFAWIHAFPYSKRPGTAAYAYPQTVSESEAVRRVDILARLAARGRRNYAECWKGKTLETVVLGENEAEAEIAAGPEKCGVNNTRFSGAYCRGLTDNYLRVLIRCADKRVPPPGTVLKCSLELAADQTGYDAQAELL